jgi:hypothetical protein
LLLTTLSGKERKAFLSFGSLRPHRVRSSRENLRAKKKSPVDSLDEISIIFGELHEKIPPARSFDRSGDLSVSFPGSRS